MRAANRESTAIVCSMGPGMHHVGILQLKIETEMLYRMHRTCMHVKPTHTAIPMPSAPLLQYCGY